MIYLIGGPPRCGKTTLARKLSERLGIPHIPADYLTSVISPYIPDKQMADRLPRWHARVKTDKSNDRMYAEFSPEEIAGFYLKEAETHWTGIKNFILYALHDRKEFIVEGAQLRPDLVSDLVRSEGPENFRTVFLYKPGSALIEELKSGTDPNDWAKRNTSEETYPKIARMVQVFGERVREQCLEHNLPAHDTSGNFMAYIDNLVSQLSDGK